MTLAVLFLSFIYFCFLSGIPSEPHAVEYTLDKNGLHINWQKPKDNGGRNDLFYRLTIRKHTS